MLFSSREQVSQPMPSTLIEETSEKIAHCLTISLFSRPLLLNLCFSSLSGNLLFTFSNTSLSLSLLGLSLPILFSSLYTNCTLIDAANDSEEAVLAPVCAPRVLHLPEVSPVRSTLTWGREERLVRGSFSSLPLSLISRFASLYCHFFFSQLSSLLLFCCSLLLASGLLVSCYFFLPQPTIETTWFVCSHGFICNCAY